MTQIRDLVDAVGDPSAFFENPGRFTMQLQYAVKRELDELRSILSTVDRFDTVRRFGLREVATDPETYSEPSHDGLLSASLLVHAVAAEFEVPRPDSPEDCTREILERLHVAARRTLNFSVFDLLSRLDRRSSSLAVFAAATADLHWGPPAWSDDRRQLLGRLFRPDGRDFVSEVCGFGWLDLCRVVDRLMGVAEALSLLSAMGPSSVTFPIAALARFPTDLLEDPTPIDEAVVEAVIRWLAVPLGADPVVDVRAAIRSQRFHPVLLANNEFACAHPDLVWWAIRQRLESDLKKDDRKYRSYERHRRRLVETEAADLIGAAVSPDARMDSAKYRIGDQELELDAVLAVGRSLIVVEAKGAPVSERSWSGHGDRLHRDLDDDTVGHASRQVGRFVRHLREAGTVMLTSGRQSIELTSDYVDDVFAVVALLDDIGPLAANTRVLDAANVELDPDAIPCVADLNTLAVMGDLLDTPWQYLHYLHRRRATATRHQYSAIEELDLVMLYLDQNLYYDDHDPATLAVGSQTDALDEWDRYQRGDRITKAKKPSQSVPVHVARVLDSLANDRPDGWVAAVFHILDLSAEARRDMNNMIKQCRALIRSDRKPHDVTLVSAADTAHGVRGISLALGPPGTSSVSDRAWFLTHLNGLRHDAERWIGIGGTCSNDVITAVAVATAYAPYEQVVPAGTDLSLPAGSNRLPRAGRQQKRRRR
jgi:hypothetical protein